MATISNRNGILKRGPEGQISQRMKLEGWNLGGVFLGS